MEIPSDPPKEKQTRWPGGTAVALVALLIFTLIVVWQMAFFYGSRQSNDLLLASPDAAVEVVQLRAQLQEARSYQTTLLNVILASFAAGFTVLVVVNFAVLFIARRDYEREEKRMREFLIREAEKRDTTVVTNADAKLEDSAKRLVERINSSTNPLLATQKELRREVKDLYKYMISTYESLASLRERIAAETATRQSLASKDSATDAERTGAYEQAALFRSQALQSDMTVPGNYVPHGDILRLIETLDKIDYSALIPDSTFATILETLTKALSLNGMDEGTANEITRAIELIREQQSASPRYVVNPPLTVPRTLATPATAPLTPLTVPIPDPSTASDE